MYIEGLLCILSCMPIVSCASRECIGPSVCIGPIVHLVINRSWSKIKSNTSLGLLVIRHIIEAPQIVNESEMTIAQQHTIISVIQFNEETLSF